MSDVYMPEQAFPSVKMEHKALNTEPGWLFDSGAFILLSIISLSLIYHTTVVLLN